MKHWASAVFGVGLETVIPQVSGVYVIASVTRVRDLPVLVRPVYAGQTKNLRRRWREHSSHQETNPRLIGLADRHDHEFWYKKVGQSRLDNEEAELIDELKPEGNRVAGRRRSSEGKK
jgi:excinuclease UvrABC nuclease subunit